MRQLERSTLTIRLREWLSQQKKIQNLVMVIQHIRYGRINKGKITMSGVLQTWQKSKRISFQLVTLRKISYSSKEKSKIQFRKEYRVKLHCLDWTQIGMNQQD